MMFDEQTPFPIAFPLINNLVLELVDARLSPDDSEFLCSIGNIKKFPKGVRILHYGNKVREIIYIKKGLVRNSHVNSNGIEKMYSYKGDGCFLALPAFFHFQPILYDSITCEDTQIAVIDRSKVGEIFERQHMIITLLKLLSLESRHLAMQVEDSNLRDTEAKICRILLCKQGLEKKLTHQDIAAIVGSHRVTVTSILSKLKKEKNIVIKKNGEIIITNFERICWKACK